MTLEDLDELVPIHYLKNHSEADWTALVKKEFDEKFANHEGKTSLESDQVVLNALKALKAFASKQWDIPGLQGAGCVLDDAGDALFADKGGCVVAVDMEKVRGFLSPPQGP